MERYNLTLSSQLHVCFIELNRDWDIYVYLLTVTHIFEVQRFTWGTPSFSIHTQYLLWSTKCDKTTVLSTDAGQKGTRKTFVLQIVVAMVQTWRKANKTFVDSQRSYRKYFDARLKARPTIVLVQHGWIDCPPLTTSALELLAYEMYSKSLAHTLESYIFRNVQSSKVFIYENAAADAVSIGWVSHWRELRQLCRQRQKGPAERCKTNKALTTIASKLTIKNNENINNEN